MYPARKIYTHIIIQQPIQKIQVVHKKLLEELENLTRTTCLLFYLRRTCTGIRDIAAPQCARCIADVVTA